MNNKLLILLCCLLLGPWAMAQHETLFNKARVIGGFGGPLIEFSDIKGDFTTSVGGGGGVIIDHFFLGAYGMGSLEHLRYNIDNDDFHMDLAHGGLWFGYTPNSFRIFHPFTSVKVGWGYADIRSGNGPIFTDGDAIFALTPEAGLELNLTKYFRISGTVGYRWVTDVDQLEGFENKDFRSLTGQITFRFGWFGRKKYNTSNPVD